MLGEWVEGVWIVFSENVSRDHREALGITLSIRVPQSAELGSFQTSPAFPYQRKHSSTKRNELIIIILKLFSR